MSTLYQDHLSIKDSYIYIYMYMYNWSLLYSGLILRVEIFANLLEILQNKFLQGVVIKLGHVAASVFNTACVMAETALLAATIVDYFSSQTKPAIIRYMYIGGHYCHLLYSQRVHKLLTGTRD